jgi:multiple sugar transport system permease protein
MLEMNETKSYTGALRAKKVLIYLVCTLLAALSIFPFWIMFVNATRTSSDIQSYFSVIPGGMLLNNFDTLMHRQNFNILQACLNSTFISGSTTSLALYISCLTAYGFFVYRFRMNKPLYTFILAVLMIPAQVSAVGFFNFMYTLGLNNTFAPLIIPAAASPAIVFFMRQYMLGALPLEIVEAARIDGAGEFQTFNIIALPLLKPAIATQAIFVFISSWNNLFTPSMILSSQDKFTMPLLVQLLQSDRFRTDYGTVYLGIALTILPLFIVYFLLSKHIIRGVSMGGVKE